MSPASAGRSFKGHATEINHRVPAIIEEVRADSAKEKIPSALIERPVALVKVLRNWSGQRDATSATNPTRLATQLT
jgi:hypothetical protein